MENTQILQSLTHEISNYENNISKLENAKSYPFAILVFEKSEEQTIQININNSNNKILNIKDPLINYLIETYKEQIKRCIEEIKTLVNE